MTKHLISHLGLPNLEDLLKEQGMRPPDEEQTENAEIDPDLEDTLALAEAAAANIAAIDGKDHGDAMDELHKENLQIARDLVDLGHNIDHARAGRIFEVGAMYYKNAGDAKDSKRKFEIEKMKLLLTQRKLDLEERKLKYEMGESSGPMVGEGETVIIEDRNELIRRFRESKK